MSLIDNPKFSYITLCKAGEAAPVIKTTTALEGRATDGMTVTGEQGNTLGRQGGETASPAYQFIMQSSIIEENNTVYMIKILLTK